MKRLSYIIRHAINTPQDRLELLMIGIFVTFLGGWLLLPEESFAPAIHFSKESLFTRIGETGFAEIFIALGAGFITYAYFGITKYLKTLYMISAMVWAFVTVGYWQTLPAGTGVVIFGFFTLWSVYLFINRVVIEKNLRYNEKIDNI